MITLRVARTGRFLASNLPDLCTTRLTPRADPGVRYLVVTRAAALRHIVFGVVLSVLAVLVACGSKDGGTTAPTPTPAPQPTRVIALSGNLEFGNVRVGSTATASLTISNSGNASLTVSGIACPSGFTANWNSGAIAAGGSQSVTITFSPASPTSYNGTVTVSSDATGGANTIAISGAGSAPPPACEANNTATLIILNSYSWREVRLDGAYLGVLGVGQQMSREVTAGVDHRVDFWDLSTYPYGTATVNLLQCSTLIVENKY